jgi:glutamine synthetase type III
MESRAQLSGQFNSKSSMQIETEQDIIDKVKDENDELQDEVFKLRDVNEEYVNQNNDFRKIIDDQNKKIDNLTSINQKYAMEIQH